MRSTVCSSVSLEALDGKLKVLAAREGSVFGGTDGDRQGNGGRLFFDAAVRSACFIAPSGNLQHARGEFDHFAHILSQSSLRPLELPASARISADR
jgi:hypothetical protein